HSSWRQDGHLGHRRKRGAADRRRGAVARRQAVSVSESADRDEIIKNLQETNQLLGVIAGHLAAWIEMQKPGMELMKMQLEIFRRQAAGIPIIMPSGPIGRA